jgi:hypothetical protein
VQSLPRRPLSAKNTLRAIAILRLRFLANILKEKGQPEEGAVRRLGEEIRALDSEPAVFSACCSIINIPAKGYLAILAYIPGGPGLQYS